MITGTPTNAPSSAGRNGRPSARFSVDLSVFGQGVCIGHGPELVQGPDAREIASNGEPTTVLMALPNPNDRAVATFHPADTNDVCVMPPQLEKARTAVERTQAYVRQHGCDAPGGYLVINSNIPIGKGRGSSTAHATAAVLAYAAAVHVPLSDAEVMRLVWNVEGASDPLPLFRWGYPVLFASREGRLIKTFSQSLPTMHCLMFDSDPEQIVLTAAVAARTRYSARHKDAMPEVFDLLERGISGADVRLIGNAATLSATLNQELLPTRHFANLLAIGQQVGSAGMAVSHSGTYAAFLWDGAHDASRQQDAAESMVAALGCTDMTRFTVHPGLTGRS